jgi:release factor glutamine methyltransferase
MTTEHSIDSLLQQAYQHLSGCSDSAWLDAEVLLSHCLKKPRSHLKAWPEKGVPPSVRTHFFDLIEQRRQQIPVAYLTGIREFWSRDFIITPNVLVPRPDTELLIEHCLSLIPDKPCRLLDLGTGSGVIAITLALECPNTHIIATDASETALEIARQNAIKHHVNTLQFMLSNWFEKIPEQEFDIIVSNPPYIAATDEHLQQGDVQHEPQSALIAQNQGLADIQQIVKQAGHYLKPDGHLLIEHGFQQQAAVQQIFVEAGFCQVETHADLAGNPRLTSGQWSPHV